MQPDACSVDCALEECMQWSHKGERMHYVGANVHGVNAWVREECGDAQIVIKQVHRLTVIALLIHCSKHTQCMPCRDLRCAMRVPNASTGAAITGLI